MIKPTKYPMNPDDMADLFDQAVNQGKNGKQDTLVSGTNIKTINGSSVLGSGDLSISSATSWGTITGTLSSQTDLNTALSGKASTGAVTGTGITMSTARILGRSTAGTGAIEEITIGSGLTLSAGTLTASGGGLTVGTTAIASGTVGRILFEGTGNVLQESANLFWDNTNGRLGIGQSTPTARIHIQGSSALSANSSLVVFNSTPTEIFRIRDNGNVQIGALTDAGFKLDVNGTARVSSYIDCRSYGSFRGDFYVYQGNGGGGFSITQTAGQSYMVGQSTHDIFMGKVGGYSFIMKNQTRIFGMDDTSGSALTNASALLTMTSTTKGFLPPRMTNAQMLAIATPAAGLVVYDTTNNKHVGYDGTAWQNFY